MTRPHTGPSLDFMRRPGFIQCECALDNPPNAASISLAKSTSPDKKVMNSQPGASLGTRKSKARKETLTG
jgi:hypothetical protein